MVRVTSKNGSNSKGNKTDSGIAGIVKAFPSLNFRVPTFKKKANSLITVNRHTKSRQSTRNGLKTINNLLKKRGPSNKKPRNKPQINYVNKSSHLTPFKSKLFQSADYEKIKPKNNKRKKRSLRRKQLKQQIEKVSHWKFNLGTNNENNDEKKNDNSVTKSSKSIIKKKRKKKEKKNTKQQVQNDQNNLTNLFKNDSFDLNPLRYTNKMLNLKKNTYNKNNKKMNVNINGELKKEITKELCKMKLKSRNKTKFKLSSNAKFKNKIKTKNRKKGKYIERKIKQKMSEFAKINQKNRRWRH